MLVSRCFCFRTALVHYDALWNGWGRHLDPGNMGYVNTRTLRILNEQKSEEKAGQDAKSRGV